MVETKKLKSELARLQIEIKTTAPGIHKKDLIRRYHKLWKELKCAEQFLKESEYGN